MSQPERVGSSGAVLVHEAERRRDPEQTRERLLDAAENLFAARGFSGTSLRAVTQVAGTSVSAANYHFGSKRALLVAMILRRTEPIARARRERLARLEARAGAASLEEVLEAFLQPLFEVRATGEGGETFRRIAARLYSDPPHVVADLKRQVFGPMVGLFSDALAGALPGASPAAVALGLQFLVGVMIHVASGNLEDAPGIDGEVGLVAISDQRLLEDVIRFTAAGLRALAAAERSEGGPR